MSDYNFPHEKLGGISYLVDSCMDDEDTPFLDSDEIDLPPPPGSVEDLLPATFQYKNSQFTLPASNSSSPIPVLGENHQFQVDTTLIPMPETKIIPCSDLEENSDSSSKMMAAESEIQNALEETKFMDDSKYSPCRMESDEENQDSITMKPKVLGKEQAKKRLMAFSLSKQPSPAVKKQNKISTPVKTTKTSNPSKGSAVQDQFRATISAIEEEKKKIMQNMPDYLLLEMTDSSKPTHQIIKSSSKGILKAQILEKPKQENSDYSSKEDKNHKSHESHKRVKDSGKRNPHNDGKKKNESKSRRRSRSRSKSKSKSKSRGNHSENRRSKSRTRKEEKNEKVDNRDKNLQSKKETWEDWKSFIAAGLSLNNETSVRKEENRKRSASPRAHTDFKPVFNYLKKENRIMTSFQARPVDHSRSSLVFAEKVIKYTLAKPVISWAENPSLATDFYMSKRMLLENCDQETASILHEIMKAKHATPADANDEFKCESSRQWYPRENYLVPESAKCNKDAYTSSVMITNETLQKVENESPKKSNNEIDVNQEESKSKEDANEIESKSERPFSLVNDSYLSDEEAKETEEVVVGDVEVQLELNSVKVRSKWDSDYDGDQSEKEVNSCGNKPIVVSSIKENLQSFKAKQLKTNESSNENETNSLNLLHAFNLKTDLRGQESHETENLVSEYEEFLKMVSFDTSDTQGGQSKKVEFETPEKSEKQKPIKEIEISKPKLETTDWDQESDREEKSPVKKIIGPDMGSQNKYIIPKTEKLSRKTRKKEKLKFSKKKLEKTKLKKSKQLKKAKKKKKKKYKDSSSSDSSSDSVDSESDYDSDDDKYAKRKKQEKFTKAKKKSKKYSSSESESESESDYRSKKKFKKKKKGKKKKSTSSDSSEKEVQSALLKQLDFKKQLIMKKIEEIDLISERSGKKKEKDHQKGKENLEECGLLKNYLKSSKKKKLEKFEKNKKKFKPEKSSLPKKAAKESRKSESSSGSDSESSEDDYKKKKKKKVKKKKRDSSESSDSVTKSKKGDKKNLKDLKDKSLNKSKKFKNEKKKKRTLSDSDSEGSSPKPKKAKKENNKIKEDDKVIREENSRSSWKENLHKEESVHKIDERDFEWRDSKPWKKSEKKTKKRKEGVNWETSSSLEETASESKTRESSWDEVAPPSTKEPISKTETIQPFEEKNISEPELTKQDTCASETVMNRPVPDSLKTSLSNYSFNENSFCGFGQELSRDFFLTEKSFSNSGEKLVQPLVEARPFQSLSTSCEVTKPPESELYSPGYSDSDASDVELATKTNQTNSNVANDVYDPLNCESETSADNNDVELSNIPLPGDSKTSLEETRNFKDIGIDSPKNSLQRQSHSMAQDFVLIPTPNSIFAKNDFSTMSVLSSFSDEKLPSSKRQIISVKTQQKLQSKAASVFQDESESEEDDTDEKTTTSESDSHEQEDGKVIKRDRSRERDKRRSPNRERDRRRSHSRERDRLRSHSRERDWRRSSSRERKISSRRESSPRRLRSRSPEYKLLAGKQEIKSDSFEIEPLKGSIDSDTLEEAVQPIPVLTGLGGTSSDTLWCKSHLPGYPSSEMLKTTVDLIDNAESFDIYPSEDPNLRNYAKDFDENDQTHSRDDKLKKEIRKSRSRSLSPRKKRRSKSPERRKSPRRRSPSPIRRERSPYSPRRRSPRRKSPSRWYIGSRSPEKKRKSRSRSPEKRRKSRSRSPRKRRSSPIRRSRSTSPRKLRSPKRRCDSPRRTDSSPRFFTDSMSPGKDTFSYPSNFQNRIPVLGATCDGASVKSTSPIFGEFPRQLPDAVMTDQDLNNPFYSREYPDDFGVTGYSEDVGANNLITVKNHVIEKSPERLSLDQRIELELGVPLSSGSQNQNEQFPVQNQQFPNNNFPSSYNCENNANSNGFYQNQNIPPINPEFNGSYFTNHPPPPINFPPFTQFPPPQPVKNSVLQVGNIVEVVPTMQQPPPPLPTPSKSQIMQIGNVLQVVPSPKVGQSASVPQLPPHDFSAPPPPVPPPLVKTQKATAVVAPSSIVPTPNPESVINPLIKAIQIEREKRRKEKEKRKAEREARRRARQLRREAKLLSVNEKLKKSVQDEGVMLGQEVDDEELLDGSDLPSPPIPVEIITVSSQTAQPPAGKGILITAGFMPKPPSEKKEVKFADGVCPGEGTSTSAEEDIVSPPPKPKLPKEKRFKKKKTKVKKKVKVQIIRQIIQAEDDDDDDDLSPPPPPPGDPPPVFFARFPFAGDAQFPVYQTQTTTTTLTTVQYPAQ